MQEDRGQERFKLYVVTDRRWLLGRSLGEALEEIVRAGATCIQLREKDLHEEAFLREAIVARKVTHRAQIPLIINDNITVCEKSGADGVHLGQQDGSVREARACLGREKLIGVTAKTPALARKAQCDGADYIGSGAIFGTQTKPDAASLSRDVLQEICAAVTIPVVAIGGITENNIAKLSHTGIAGVAVVSAVFAAADLTAQTRLLRHMVDGMVFSPEENKGKNGACSRKMALHEQGGAN